MRQMQGGDQGSHSPRHFRWAQLLLALRLLRRLSSRHQAKKGVGAKPMTEAESTPEGEGTPIPAYLASLFESKSFQDLLDKLGTDQPHWHHNCKVCHFLGSYRAADAPGNPFDLYVHEGTAVALSARYGPNDTDLVIATVDDAELHQLEAPDHPVIEALRRWKAMQNGEL